MIVGNSPGCPQSKARPRRGVLVKTSKPAFQEKNTMICSTANFQAVNTPAMTWVWAPAHGVPGNVYLAPGSLLGEWGSSVFVCPVSHPPPPNLSFKFIS